jgi:hypothetical protein
VSYTREEIRAAGLDDFRVFLRQVWDFLKLPVPTPVQNDIARWLQHGPRRLQISAFRGVGKTWITVAFCLWCLLLNPNLKIMVVSANKDTAALFTKFAKQLIHGMPLLQHLRATGSQNDSSVMFDVGPADPSKDPSFKSVGITGQLTGSRADIIIADDVEVPKNSGTHHLREHLVGLVAEFDSIIKPGGRIIYLGTPQVEESLYAKLAMKLDADGNPLYKMVVWPAQIPSKPENYSGRLAPYVQRMIDAGEPEGTAVDPVRFDLRDLMERQASYGMTGYALQFMLDVTPQSADKHPLKLRDLIVADVDNEQAPVKLMWTSERSHTLEDLPAGGLHNDRYQRPFHISEEIQKFGGTVMAVDPSGMGKDETAVAIVRFLHGYLYLVAVHGFRVGFSEETLQGIAKLAKDYSVNDIIVEKNYGGGMFNQLLRPHLVRVGAAGIDEEWKGQWSMGMKEARILDTLEPVVQSHRLVVDRKVIEEDWKIQQEEQRYSWVYQFTRMERLKGALAHDDRIEVIAMAVRYWVDRMHADSDRAVARHHERLLDEELRRFKANVFGHRRPNLNIHRRRR